MELCRIFDMAQPGMSHHLKILSTAGLLETRREGNSIFYRRALISADDPLADLQKSFCHAIDQLSISHEVKNRMGDIHEERASNSRNFFSKNADKFKENQDLIAQYSQYAGCLNNLLSNEQLEASGSAVEIGPGDTDLLTFLSDSFDKVLAIDNAEEMLNLAREKVAGTPCKNIDFYLGEIGDLPSQDTKVDLIVLNMVLHHLAAPSRFFEDAAATLNLSGTLLIVDLCPHNQDWARDICGDIWLGFDPQDLDVWAGQSGFEAGQSIYLGLKNGFQIQMRLFHLINEK